MKIFALSWVANVSRTVLKAVTAPPSCVVVTTDIFSTVTSKRVEVRHSFDDVDFYDVRVGCILTTM